MGDNRILQGVTGGKRILLHCRDLTCTKGYKGKGYPAPIKKNGGR